MSFHIDHEPANAVMARFVDDMHELYVEEFKQFLRDAAEQAINEAAEKVRERLEVRAQREYSVMSQAPIIKVLFELHK